MFALPALTSIEVIAAAHTCGNFSAAVATGDAVKAARLYQEAIKALPTDGNDGGRAHMAALHSNRAAALMRCGQPIQVLHVGSIARMCFQE